MASVNMRMTVSSLLRVAADTLFPPQCPACRAGVSADGNYCAACYAKLRMIAPPCCARCGIPFAVAMGEGAECPTCLSEPPSFDTARAAMVYDALSAPLVSALKFHDQWAAVERIAAMMQASAGAMLEGVDAIVPVPLHWRRLLQRKYNQSALLGFHLAKRTGLRCEPGWLRRVQFTPPQMRLDRATRLKNVARAFAVPEGADLANKTILLVDDVVTTGATANACAKALKKAGAREVRVLSLARTVVE